MDNASPCQRTINMKRQPHLITTLIFCSMPIYSLSADNTLSPAALRELAAVHSGYYDELDLALFDTLESGFTESSQVFKSKNTVRLGNLDVSAKIVVPAAVDSEEERSLFHTGQEPVRIMLDYALVSCRHGCTVGLLNLADNTLLTYSASHRMVRTKRGQKRTLRRTASMVLIEGDQAREAVKQLGHGGPMKLFLTTAIYGPAEFQFEIPAGT